eukprot:2934562-Pyramimonas_sp.AAC.5
MGVLVEEVVEWLLANGHHLAAFELMLELQEGGQDPGGLTTLSKFFQDERRFPAEALAKYEDADGKDHDAYRMFIPIRVISIRHVRADWLRRLFRELSILPHVDLSIAVESQKGLLKTKDDKISLLEYELRLAREDMEELQELHEKDLLAASKGTGCDWFRSRLNFRRATERGTRAKGKP